MCLLNDTSQVNNRYFQGIIHELHLQGYGGGVFGTTWGDAGVTPVGLVELKCSYVKQLRSVAIRMSVMSVFMMLAAL